MSQSDFTPDRDNLDDEWVRQPELYHSYAVQLADARKVQDERKNKLEVIQAELDSEIRQNPEEFGLESRVTEGSIKATIIQHSRYTKALQRLLDAKHSVDILQAAVVALDHKKKALENLVYLHGQDYFSSPKARGEDREKMEEVTRKVRSKKRNPNLTRRNIEDD